MNLNKYLDVKPEVAQAIAQGKPVVALESTIISHGMPYPQNVETALNVEKIIRENGAVPATIAIIGGRLKAGLTPEEIEYFGKKGQAIAKASRRDLAVLCARGEDGATTVTTTMIIAHMAGIRVFATGGIGGVHRGAETTMDISADLEELAHTPVMVVCAGAKSILDLGLTLEYLETHGVPVIGYGTEELPAFYTRTSGFSPFPRPIPWIRPSSTAPLTGPLPSAGRRASTAKPPPPSSWPGWRRSPAATAWLPTSSWSTTTPAWLPKPPLLIASCKLLIQMYREKQILAVHFLPERAPRQTKPTSGSTTLHRRDTALPSPGGSHGCCRAGAHQVVSPKMATRCPCRSFQPRWWERVSSLHFGQIPHSSAGK